MVRDDDLGQRGQPPVGQEPAGDVGQAGSGRLRGQQDGVRGVVLERGPDVVHRRPVLDPGVRAGGVAQRRERLSGEGVRPAERDDGATA